VRFWLRLVELGGQGKLLLVGDNPFHGISHLSQERSRVRGDTPTNPEYAARLIGLTVSCFLSAIQHFQFWMFCGRMAIIMVCACMLLCLTPTNMLGLLPGLAKKLVREIVFSGNLRAVASGLNGVVRSDLASLFKTYFLYEVSRVRRSAGGKAKLESVMLHQLITDLCLGLGLDWVFKFYTEFLLKKGVTPGFNTGNFALLVEKRSLSLSDFG